MGPQICAAGGGGGGKPPEAPGNQELEASGSADRMVISGRLETSTDNRAATTNQKHNLTRLRQQ